MRAAWIAIAIAAACQNGKQTPAAGSGSAPSPAPGSAAPPGSDAAPGSAAGSAAPAGDSCTPVNVCAAFSQPLVDQRCGVKTVTTTALDEAPRDNAMVDSCQYNDDKHAPLVYIGRTCIPGSGGGAPIATQLYGVDRTNKPATDVQLDLQSIGDQGYVRISNDKTHASVVVRKGNVIITIRHMAATPTTLSVIQKECLLALYRELAAK